MTEDIKRNVKDKSRWLRLLYIILYVVIFQVVEIVVGLTILVQFVGYLFSGRTLERLRTLGDSMGAYMHQMVAYATFASDERPYPFGAWPRPAPAAAEETRDVAAAGTGGAGSAGEARTAEWQEPRPESEIGPDE